MRLDLSGCVSIHTMYVQAHRIAKKLESIMRKCTEGTEDMRTHMGIYMLPRGTVIAE